MAALTVIDTKVRINMTLGDRADNSPDSAAVQIFYRLRLNGSSISGAVEIPVLLSSGLIEKGQHAVEEQARMHALTVLDGLAASLRKPRGLSAAE